MRPHDQDARPGGSVATEGYGAVLEVLQRYYDGLYRCDVALLESVFHPQAVYATASDGKLLHLDMNAYFPLVAARTSPQKANEAYGYEVESIAFAGPAAALARMRCSMLSKDFIDLLTLVRVDGGWRILAKIFHYAPRAPAAHDERS